MTCDTKTFAKMLEEQKKELESLIASASDSAKPVELDQTMQGRVSRIDAIQQQEMQKAAQARRKAQISRIDAALARIESGDFGYCVACDEEIAEKRLALDPSTPSCLKCASGGELT